MKQLLTLEDLCRELELPVSWVRREAKAGRLPYVQIGASKRFSAAAVEAHLLDRAAQLENGQAVAMPDAEAPALPFE